MRSRRRMEGYVTLVRAEWTADGTLKETNDKNGIWAWKHPHKADGTVTYTPLKGRYPVGGC